MSKEAWFKYYEEALAEIEEGMEDLPPHEAEALAYDRAITRLRNNWAEMADRLADEEKHG